MARRYPELAHLPPAEYRKAVKNKWREGKPRKDRRVQSAEYLRKRRYGIDEAAYQALLARQHGHCAICPSTEDLVVDHCHDGGHVRGILCRKCNVLLGMAGDDVERLAAAVRYLS